MLSWGIQAEQASMHSDAQYLTTDGGCASDFSDNQRPDAVSMQKAQAEKAKLLVNHSL